MSTLLAASDGIIFLVTPGLAATGAYSWAGQIFPTAVWGSLFACSALTGGVALTTEGRGSPWPVHLARLALLLYGLCTLAFGLSIFLLTLNGVSSALTGATKWWLPFLLSARIFMAPRMTKHWEPLSLSNAKQLDVDP